MSDPLTSEQQQQVDADRRAIGPWQTWLEQYCASNRLRPPIYSLASDRRGGRTAWSSAVEVNGTGYSARYWYDGNFITNAKEDAAQVALERLESPAEHQQHQEQHHEYNQQLQAQAQAQAQAEARSRAQGTQQQEQERNPTDSSQQSQNMWQGYNH